MLIFYYIIYDRVLAAAKVRALISVLFVFYELFKIKIFVVFESLRVDTFGGGWYKHLIFAHVTDIYVSKL